MFQWLNGILKINSEPHEFEVSAGQLHTKYINITELSGDTTITAKFTSTNITYETRTRVFDGRKHGSKLCGMKILIAPTRNLSPWCLIGIVPPSDNENAIGIAPTKSNHEGKISPIKTAALKK